MTAIIMSGPCIVLLVLTRIGRITHSLVGMPVLCSNDIITLLVFPVLPGIHGSLCPFLSRLVLVLILVLRILARIRGLFNILIRIHKNHFFKW